MLLQDVKTPLVADSKMFTERSTMGSAEGKRKAGPDALAALDAKKRATSPGLPKSSILEDNTSLEGSSKDDENVPPDFDLYASDEESETPLPDGTERIVYDTGGPFDLTALRDAVSLFHEPDTNSYYKRFNLIKDAQFAFEKEYGGRKVHMNVLFTKEGDLIFYILEGIK